MSHPKRNLRLSDQMIMNRLHSRRQFLIGTGQTILALPPLLSLMPRSVEAQVIGTKVVRYVSMLGYLGIDYQQWTPVNQTGLTFMPGQDSIGYKPLNQFAGNISRVIDTSFTDLYPDMNIISGLSLTGGNYQGHNESVLSGTHSGARAPIYGKSIDVICEQSKSVYSATTTIQRRSVRVVDDSNLEGFSFDRVNGNRVVSSYIRGDLALFNALLSSLTGGTGVVSATQAQANANRKLVVDQVYTDLSALMKRPEISTSDRQLLDQYISGVQDLQKRVLANTALPVNISCKQPTLSFQAMASGNKYTFPSSDWGITSRDAMYNNYIEAFRLAAMCDVTRVFHWGMSAWDSNIVPGGTVGGLHHSVPSSDLQADRQQYGIKKLAALARAFKSTPDPINGGTLLDNSIMFYTNELGAWTTAHNIMNIPTITFGLGGGKVNSGYFIDCRQTPLTMFKGYYPGRPYKQFLQAVMSTMGVPKSEYMAFGDGNGFGEFNPNVSQFGATGNVFGRYAAVHNEPLPFFYK